MDESERLPILVTAVRMLNEAHSWTGRTHIHKFLYLAKELAGFDSGYDFVLYQRGPYSFNLDSDVRSARSISVIDIAPMGPYGPSYRATEQGENFAKKARLDDLERARLGDLANAVGPKSARDLELLATTLYVTNEGTHRGKELAERVIALKPHFTEADVNKALAELEHLRTKIR